MKKVFAFILVAFSVFFVFGCKKNEKTQETQPTEVASQPTEVKDPTKPVETKTPDAPVTDIFTKGEGVMTYSEYVNAALDSDVVIEAFIQGVQTFNPAYNNITLYLADKDGAYFVYRAPADQELADKCTLGTKVKVSGTKSAWSGEVEITNATIEFEEGSYIASSHEIEYLDEDAIEFQNQLVTITYAVVQDKGDGAAFLYKYNGSGSHEENSDLYYDVEIFGNTFTFVVESDLCDNTTDVYAAVEGLQVGDVLEITGFLYWYEGPQLHTTVIIFNTDSATE